MTETETERIVDILKDIRKYQRTQTTFNTGTALTMALASSVSFIIALALNDGFRATYALFRNDASVGTIWFYACIIIIIGIILLILIYIFLKPILQNIFNTDRCKK